jgi:hypothetical protein
VIQDSVALTVKSLCVEAPEDFTECFFADTMPTTRFLFADAESTFPM